MTPISDSMTLMKVRCEMFHEDPAARLVLIALFAAATVTRAAVIATAITVLGFGVVAFAN